MCKVVYLTTKSFDSPAKLFRDKLAEELEHRGVEVVKNSTNWFKRLFAKHRTYGIALAIDFFRDGYDGCGLILNEKCSNISREFAYNISNTLDLLTPHIRWRDCIFVNSYNPEWFRFFNNVSSNTKAIFYLCTYNNPVDLNNYNIAFYSIIQAFADDIVRCLRSNYDYNEYMKNVRRSKQRFRFKDNEEEEK